MLSNARMEKLETESAGDTSGSRANQSLHRAAFASPTGSMAGSKAFTLWVKVVPDPSTTVRSSMSASLNLLSTTTIVEAPTETEGSKVNVASSST